MRQALLELGGSFGEGGGQILRTSLALSLVTGRPFHLRKIRAGRSKPGLQPQHLASVRAAAAISQAEVKGASLNSTDLVFEPGAVTAGRFRFAIGTAGATALVLHTIYLPLALRSGGTSVLIFEGGTHVPHSPCFHFLDVTWRHYMGLIGIEIALKLQRTGFYPRGGGAVQAEIRPCPRVRGLELAERRAVAAATGISAVAGLPDHISKRQAQRAVYRLEQAGLSADIREVTWSGGPGSVLTVVLETKPVPALFFGLGARGKPAERVADEAVDQGLAFLKAAPAAVDSYSADQLVLPLAMAEEISSFSVAEMTAHLLTNVAVIRQFLERKIVCEGSEGSPGWVRIG
jgi:RNA 3'-terminal phosphate cyclase (ATP)